MTWDVNSYSATPASNTAINGINIGEGCNASGINDAIRQLMADIKGMLSIFVSSVAGRTGVVTLAKADITDAGTAIGFDVVLSASDPSGTPTKPTIWVKV